MLLGGWRLVQDYSRASMAIDFQSRRCVVQGHQQQDNATEFTLPTMGTGKDPLRWPQVQPKRKLNNFWGLGKYCNGLCFWQGKFWASPRTFYDMNPPNTLTISAEDGEKKVINLPQQMFSGFVKRGPGLEPFIGCGGYESGQGSTCGPTLATMAGQRLISRPLFGGSWDEREVRDPDYSTPGNGDSWPAYAPRNGEGRWASDWLSGGGLVLAEGISYWPLLGTGLIAYENQARCLATRYRSSQYTYDPTTYKLKDLKPYSMGWVGGQEIDSVGNIYLSHESFEGDVIVACYGSAS